MGRETNDRDDDSSSPGQTAEKSSEQEMADADLANGEGDPDAPPVNDTEAEYGDNESPA